MQPVGPCLWRKDLSWEFGSKQRQVQTLGTHRCPPKDREKDTIREAKAKTGQGFKALVCFLKYVFRFWITFGKKTSCLLPSLLFFGLVFFALFWALFRHVCLRVSNGPGRFGSSASQGSFLTCFEVPRFQTDPVIWGRASQGSVLTWFGARGFFFKLFRVLLRLRVSNGPGRFGGKASQGSFLTCFEV